LEARRLEVISEVATAATTAVQINGCRVGTAALVDSRHLLTARHAVESAGTATEIDCRVVFPGTGRNFAVEIIDLGEPGHDIAVLRLGEPIDGNPAKPFELWPFGRLPETVAAFGYPMAERGSEGVWRRFKVSGRTTTGLQQLEWTEGVGTFVGHSGGPVIESDTGILVGIVLAGSEAGRFDRFITLPQSKHSRLAESSVKG
jgi:trypsin-like peptidase